MSVWAPVSYWSTRPGFGDSSASLDRAARAILSISAAMFPIRVPDAGFEEMMAMRSVNYFKEDTGMVRVMLTTR